MEHVTKVFFNPLAPSKTQIQAFLKTLPVGSAHPYRTDGFLLCHVSQGVIKEIDISMHPEEYFSNAVSLADLGENTLDRMKMFQSHIGRFNDEYMIQQAPSLTFKVPLSSNEITIFAVSKREPTFYDLCVADSGHRTSCYSATKTFPGVTHSGDITTGDLLLQHIRFDRASLTEAEYAIFVSGYSHTKLTSYKRANPLLLVANHAEKVLYVVPVPLDTASIGDAILCAPMVVKACLAENLLTCSILPTPTTDDNMMCSGATLSSDCFRKAVDRANFTVEQLATDIDRDTEVKVEIRLETADVEKLSFANDNRSTSYSRNVILATQAVAISDIGASDSCQIIRFGNGIDWMIDPQTKSLSTRSPSVLPCILGGVLEGPLLLATGEMPTHMPFQSDLDLRRYYRQAESVVIVIDDKMTDNARNLATPWRINGLFVVQIQGDITTKGCDDESVLNGLNINAVTALAGPQSLVLVQMDNRYLFYRGIANFKKFDTSQMKFGEDVTELLKSLPVGALMDAAWPRLINLSEENDIFLPKSTQSVQPKGLKQIFENIPLAELISFKDDILATIPQLQVLLDQKHLQAVCTDMLTTLESKIDKAGASTREAYVDFLTKKHQAGDIQSEKKKQALLGELRRVNREAKSNVGWLTDALGNVVSSQDTSTRKHDIKRLLRKSAIQGNVEAVKSMTFTKLAGLLEEHAEEMGVLLVNVDTTPYQEMLSNRSYDVTAASNTCKLDSRVLHLEGFDAGIILEQSQSEHHGPLVSQSGPAQPILALPYLSPQSGTGSMIAWVCWDEFVNLEDPYGVRWMEKCNDAHIAALRIMMRSTLSNAVSSREHNMTASSLETGQLMGSLLMAAMDKLALTRTSSPVAVVKAMDTTTKLMRGLFGHLLSVAGSGTRPLSMVWQLFGTNPQFDAPIDESSWSWYENVARLLPYTGWPAMQFNQNLEKLLDKVIFRLVTRHRISDLSSQRSRLEEACRARNIQLLHSRTIISAMMKMLTELADRQNVAKNLLQLVPQRVENETHSYTRLYHYLQHLAGGGQTRSCDSLLAANVYTRRSAAFSDLKKDLDKALRDGDSEKAQEHCKAILDRRNEVGKIWGIEAKDIKVQGIKAIQNLLSAQSTDPEEVRKLHMQIMSDAEKHRQPWQIGSGEYGSIEPLDSELLEEIMTGTVNAEASNTLVLVDKKEEVGLAKFDRIAKPGFLKSVEALQDWQEVCTLLQIPANAMKTFTDILSPNFRLEQLPSNFQAVVYDLLSDPNQETKKPTKQLLQGLAITGT